MSGSLPCFSHISASHNLGPLRITLLIFLCRSINTLMPSNLMTLVRDFLAAGRDDAVVTLHPPAEAEAACRSRGLPTTVIPVRLIRVLLPTGEVEILMTSLLDRDDHPAEEFATLYHLRWAQEENYKCFKCRVEVENWSGKSSLAIR